VTPIPSIARAREESEKGSTDFQKKGGVRPLLSVEVSRAPHTGTEEEFLRHVAFFFA
jgi:hypothetical protein